MSDPHPIETAEARWGIDLKHASGDEFVGPCPFCKGGEDRFHVWEAAGNYWCRQCGAKGFIDSEHDHRLTEVERRLLMLESEQRRQRIKQAEHEKRLSALEKMHRCRDHLTYHELMDQDDRAYWHSQGMTDATIDKYLLGVCYSCPTDAQHRPSYTIPVINGGKLVNIRHRLRTSDGDRYRPHMAGLGNTLFMADNVYKEDTSQVLILEGEKKALCVSQYGYDPVGIMGKAGFQRPWAKRFARFDEVVIMLDPDAERKAFEMATWFETRARVARLPVKADDFFTIHHGSASQFAEYVGLAWRVH